jgi:hypothetical protein
LGAEIANRQLATPLSLDIMLPPDSLFGLTPAGPRPTVGRCHSSIIASPEGNSLEFLSGY